MRLTLPMLMAGLAVSASAAAQDAGQRIVLRDVVRTVSPRVPNAAAALGWTTRAYQGRDRGPEQTERFSRKVKIGRDGRVSIANISGDIVVTAGSGDEVSIEAVKRTRGSQNELASVHIEVAERQGRVDVQTTHAGRSDHVSVDYTVTVPLSATLDLHSVSGALKITGVRGSVRAETVSGNVTTTDTPKLESARSVSGNVSLTSASADGDLSAGTVSGNLTAKGMKAHGLDLGSVSGDISLSDVMCDRLGIKSVSGSVEYGGSIAKSGRYDINTHSGTVRLVLASPSGFELNATSFSGSIRSDLPLTIGGDSARRGRDAGRRRDAGFNSHSMRATFGDGSATLIIRTFSGDIIIAKR
jgi:DUF4097 and DUF4098 domain-containing protein YvlB